MSISVSLPLIGVVQLARDPVICKALGKTPGEMNQSSFDKLLQQSAYRQLLRHSELSLRRFNRHYMLRFSLDPCFRGGFAAQPIVARSYYIPYSNPIARLNLRTAVS